MLACSFHCSCLNNICELAIERRLKLLNAATVAEVCCSFIIEFFKILFLCLNDEFSTSMTKPVKRPLHQSTLFVLRSL